MHKLPGPSDDECTYVKILIVLLKYSYWNISQFYISWHFQTLAILQVKTVNHNT